MTFVKISYFLLVFLGSEGLSAVQSSENFDYEDIKGFGDPLGLEVESKFLRESANQCNVNNNTEFECRQVGVFPDPTDLTCTSYYVCVKLLLGTFLRIHYSCQIGTRFDPYFNLCTWFYKCPCEKTTVAPYTTSTTTKKPTTTTTAHPVTTSTTTTSNETTTDVETTTFDYCPTDEDTDFHCTIKGRFKKPNDLTCMKYYLCSLLRNGSFIQTEYTCPDGSYFDQKLTICSIYFVCPCTKTTESSTTELSTTSTTESTTETSTTIQTTTTDVETTTFDYCPTDEDADFHCTLKGRFKKPNDLTCTKYYLCSLLRNGSFIQTEYTCPDGSYFDQKLTICSIYFVCPCTTTTESSTTELSTTSTTESTTETSTTSTTESTTETSTTTETTTTDVETTTFDYCPTDEDADFHCSLKGRFKKPNDLTCTKYYLCSLLRNGSFIQTEYTCPDGSYFDQKLTICSIYFVCPCTTTTESSTTELSTTSTTESTTELSTTTTAVETTTTTEFTTRDPCIPPSEDNFECIERGRFPVPTDVFCDSYYLCSKLKNGTFIQTEFYCPREAKFDPVLQYCNVKYSCRCTL